MRLSVHAQHRRPLRSVLSLEPDWSGPASGKTMLRRLRHPPVIARWRTRRSDIGRLRRAGRVQWGEGSYGSPRVLTFAHDATRLIVGSYVSIAQNVTIVLGGNHKITSVSCFPHRIRGHLPGAGSDGFPWSKGDVIIGSDVWIGVGVTILSGATIEHGAVVAAGSVVTGRIPAYSLVGGNPARVIRSRFSDQQVEQLLEIAWWDWDPDTVMGRAEALSEWDVDRFIERYGHVP